MNDRKDASAPRATAPRRARARAALVLAMAAGAAAPAAPASAQEYAAATSPRVAGGTSDSVVACLASRLIASPYDTVRISLATDSVLPGAAYRWSSTGGTLVDSGATALWWPTGGSAGLYTIEARVSVGGSPYGSCMSRVLVVPPRVETRGGGDRVLRFGLTRGLREEPGWGRYNYLLMGSRPADPAQTTRFRAVLARFLARLDDAADYVAAAEQSLAPSDTTWRRDFSVTLIPLRAASDSLEAVLVDYDFARAKLLLSSLPGTHADGPYLVSVAQPLSGGTDAARDFVLIDLSHISPALAGQWTNYFVQQATVDYPRSGFDMRRGLLVMRTALAQLGAGTSEIARGLATWRKLFDDVVSWTK